jgi:hypothetical protein
VCAIAWKAQTRLCQGYRQMMAKGKPNQVVVTAIARELAGFVWSIACITSGPALSNNTVNKLYNEVTILYSKVEAASGEVAQQVQQVTPATGRPRVPRYQLLKGTARHAGQPGQTRTASAKRSRTG